MSYQLFQFGTNYKCSRFPEGDPKADILARTDNYQIIGDPGLRADATRQAEAVFVAENG